MISDLKAVADAVTG